MKIIIGLGNPGEKYHFTRHNIGFLVTDYLANQLSAIPIKSNPNSILSQTIFHKQKIILAQPQTFMNLSGKAVGELMQFYKLASSDFLIITDDYYIKFGTIKLLAGGGDGGHNGLKSIIQQVGRGIPRLRIGVGTESTENYPIPLEKYVLGNFTQTEQKELPFLLNFVSEICLNWIQFNIHDAMNRFNRRSYKDF